MQTDHSTTKYPYLFRTHFFCNRNVSSRVCTVLTLSRWVFSSETPSNESSGQMIYTPAASSSSSALTGQSWQISYGDGSGARGNVYADSVAVGAVTVTRQAVEAATSVSASFTGDTASSGIFGLAFSNINTVTPTKQKTFFANAQQQLASPLFTSRLKYHAPGTYNFGYIDSSSYSGDIAYTPVNTAGGFWQFNSSGYAVGTGAFVSTPINSVADTGTSLLLTSEAAVEAYYSQVASAYNDQSGAGGYVFPCETTLPSFSIGVGNYRGVIPGQYINYAPYENGLCFGGIQSDTGIGMAIYGDVLLKSQFVVWDGGNTRLGFAQQSDVSGAASNGAGGSRIETGGGFGDIIGELFGFLRK